MLLDLEIKPTTGQEAPTGRVVAEAVARLWKNAATPPLLSSFSPEALQTAAEAAPHLPRGLLLDRLWDGWAGAARRLGCVALVCNHVLWDAERVAQAKSLGLRCLSYTVNDAPEAARLIALGTDGLITDRVDLFAPAGIGV
jgi:glycerophosphoryl diester phosphodiesterase